jgi:hypothetical protein
VSATARRAALLGILVGALALRLTGLGWGLPRAGEPPLHPDEHVVYEGSRALYASPGAMEFYWGGAQYARLGLLARLAVRGFVPAEREFAAVLVALRALNAALALATIALVLWIARAVAGPGCALVAAALLACMPGPVLDAHYARPDVLAATGATAALACAVRAARGGGRGLLWLGGLASGFAGAALLAAAVGLAPLAAAARERAGAGWWRELARIALAALAGYALGSFESAFHPDAARAGLARAAQTHGGGDLALLTRVPLYAFGAPAALAGAAGLVQLALRRATGDRTLVAFALAGALALSGVGGDMMRHVDVLAPVVAIAGALALVGTRAHRRAARAAPALACIAWTLALSLAYVLPLALERDPRERAGSWLAAHAPAGARVAVTKLFIGDHTYGPRLPREHPLRLEALPLRAGVRLPRAAELDFDYLVTSDQALTHPPSPAAARLLEELRSGGRYRAVAEFGPRRRAVGLAERLGITPPSDLLYVRPTLFVLERVR